MTTTAALQKALHKYRGSFVRIARESGVPHSTIRKLACGAYKNPGENIKAKVLAWLDTQRKSTAGRTK